MNFTDRVIESAVSNLPLVVFIFGSLLWMLKTMGPRAVKMSLENGGGEVIQKHMEVALLRQDLRLQAQMRSLIKDHEEVERRGLETQMTESRRAFERTVEDIDERLSRVENRRSWF